MCSVRIHYALKKYSTVYIRQMINPNYLLGFIGIVAVGKIYEKWRKSTETDEQIKTYQLVKEYLLNDSSLAKSSKPLLWIHVPHELNARNWLSFNSRMTDEVNRPYLFLTIKSIVEKCAESFNICLINDDTFGKILPGWTIDLCDIAEPVRSRMRHLALARTLYYYGGMAVPPSLLCFDNLHTTYTNALSSNSGGAFVGEFVDRSITADETIYSPDMRLMGCAKNSKTMSDFADMLMLLISRDYTDQPKFLGSVSQWWSERINAREAGLVCAKTLGVETPSGPMTVEMLMGSTYYTLDKDAVALYIPEDELHRRTAFKWFERQSPEQVLSGHYLIGVYMLSALASN